MFLGLEETVNVSASPDSGSAIDQRMRDHLGFVMLDVAANTRLDCGGLSWCSPGGTGRLEVAGGPGSLGPPFPDGTNTVMPLSGSGGTEFRLRPGAGVNEIKAGDTLVTSLADGTQKTGALGFVFATVPAIRSWSLSSGAGATVSYPVPGGTPGTRQNPIAVSPGPDGRRLLTLEFWRPQRHSIAGAEKSGYIDIGHLVYQANFPLSSSAAGTSPTCPSSTVTTTSSELSANSGNGVTGLVDSSNDRPSDASRMLNLTVDLDACASARGGSLAAGQLVNFDLAANAPSSSSVDHANQTLMLSIAN